MANRLSDFRSIPDQHISKYIVRVIEGMSTEQLHEFLLKEHSNADIIKDKIKGLTDIYAEKKFKDLLNSKLIRMQPDYSLPTSIIPGELGKDIANSLYEREGHMNGFEERVISEIAALPNIVFWHRNLGRGKGFSINGFKSNHYPDFIILTKKRQIILLETKGNDRDNSDTEGKIRLGKEWAHRAGDNYNYFMVFEKNRMQDALTVEELKNAVRNL